MPFYLFVFKEERAHLQFQFGFHSPNRSALPFSLWRKALFQVELESTTKVHSLSVGA